MFFFLSVRCIAMHQIKLRIQSIVSWISFVCSIKLLNHSNRFIHTPQNLFWNRRHLIGWKGIRGRSTHNWQEKSNENRNNKQTTKKQNKTTQIKKKTNVDVRQKGSQTQIHAKTQKSDEGRATTEANTFLYYYKWWNETEHGKDMRFNSKNNAIKQIKENGNKRSEQQKRKLNAKEEEEKNRITPRLVWILQS